MAEPVSEEGVVKVAAVRAEESMEVRDAAAAKGEAAMAAAGMVWRRRGRRAVVGRAEVRAAAARGGKG